MQIDRQERHRPSTALKEGLSPIVREVYFVSQSLYALIKKEISLFLTSIPNECFFKENHSLRMLFLKKILFFLIQKNYLFRMKWSIVKSTSEANHKLKHIISRTQRFYVIFKSSLKVMHQFNNEVGLKIRSTARTEKYSDVKLPRTLKHWSLQIKIQTKHNSSLNFWMNKICSTRMKSR